MKARNTLLVLTIAAAIPAANLSFAQTATVKPATPVAASATTAVPALVPYSGVLVAADGKNLAAESGITFQIYKDEVGGESLWTETQAVAIDATGHYKVQLGAANPNGLPADLFSTGEARWLEVQVAGQEPQPRVLLASVPYALKAADATTLGGLPASAFALAGTRTNANLAPAATSAIAPDGTTNVTTTGGTTGYVPVFTGASSVGNSILYSSSTGIGVGDVPNSTAVFDVNGKSIWRGLLNVSRAGTATTSTSYPSYAMFFQASAYDSSSKSVHYPAFQLQAEPTGNNTATPGGTFNLLYSSNSSTPAETGLYFNPDGTIHFVSGQTFPGGPGMGTITAVHAGTALTGGGTTGSVTLNVDTTKVPLLAANNTFTGNQGVTGTETVSGNVSVGASLLLPNTSSPSVGVVQLGATPFLSNYGPTNGNNAFIGGAGDFKSTGTANTGTGYHSLNSTTSGAANTANGAFSLLSETTATANTGIGYDSLRNTTTGSYNSGLGYAAAFYNTTGSLNTAIGYQAGAPSGVTALSNTTAIGANATVSQSNSLVLGNTSATPGAKFVNVGVGTSTPRSVLEAAVSAPEALGPSLTLTNSVGNGDFGGSSLDFNTYLPGTSGTYNPSSRIEAFGDGGGGDSLWFLSNNDNTFGGPNQGLNLNMIIGSNGRINIGTQDTDPNDFAEQLVVHSVSQQGNSEVAAIGAFGSAATGTSDAYGSRGVYAFGGDAVGNAQADFAGDGGYFEGGYTPESSSGPAGYGIYATGGVGGVGVQAYAGYFEGNIEVTGTVFGSAKDFKIDHPLDPANKYLVHTSVESSEMMNIYSGNVTTDELGLATVTMPDWFQAENIDFRYQLTIVDERFAQAVVSKRMENNKFTIHTNASNVQVSWQITAVRQDAYAKAHPVVVEQEKPVAERGFYQNPELFGQPTEKQTEWGRRPKAMQQMKAQQDARKAALARTKSNGGALRHDQPASAVNRNFASAAPGIK